MKSSFSKYLLAAALVFTAMGPLAEAKSKTGKKAAAEYLKKNKKHKRGVASVSGRKHDKHKKHKKLKKMKKRH